MSAVTCSFEDVKGILNRTIARSRKIKARSKGESDWKNLAGLSPSALRTRTRNGGNGRPNLSRACCLEAESDSSSSESEWNESSAEDSYCSTDDEEDEAELAKEKEKPPASRVIVEVDLLTKAFEANAICQQCAGPVSLDVKTVCLTSSLVVTCNNVNCGYVFHGDQPAATTIHKDTNDNRERSTDYCNTQLFTIRD
jgi:hypothetical protein